MLHIETAYFIMMLFLELCTEVYISNCIKYYW